MKKIKKVVESVEREHVVEHTCDICGQDMMVDCSYDREKEIRVAAGMNRFGDFGPSDINVELRLAAGWPEGGTYVTFESDICEYCFLTVLKPFIESHRQLSIRRTEGDW
jgi:hypothetical protein